MAGLAGEVANLVVQLRLDDSGFSPKINNANRALSRLERGGVQVGRGMAQVGGGVVRLAERAALAAGAGLAAVVTTAASFEQAEAGIRKTVGGTTEEVDTLIDTIKEMSREVPLSFEELAAITAEGGALGIANENLAEFTDIVARLGVSTDLTTEAAASALGHLTNVLGLSDADMRDFADSLVALGNDGASTESEIIDLAQRFGAAGRQAGLSNEEILALASTTASMGIEAEAGGGALSRVFNNITTDIATASDEGEALAEGLGVSLSDLRKAWDKDAGAVFEDLLGYIRDLDQFEAQRFLKDIGITNTRDINAILLLAEGVDEYGRQLGVAEGQTNELNKESDVFFQTSQGKWETLKNNVRLAADVIGAELLPVVNDLADDFVGWLRDPATQRGLRDFSKDLAKGIRDLVDELKDTDFSGLIGGMKIAAEVAKGAFDAFTALPQPIQQPAIAALVANKVSGGAVGQIAKGLGNIVFGGANIFRGLRGGTPATPQYVWVVNQTPGVGGGGKPPIAGAPPGFLAPGLGTAAAGVALPFLMFNLIPELFKVAGAKPTGVERVLADGSVVKLDAATTAQLTAYFPQLVSQVEESGGRIVREVGAADESIDATRDAVRALHDPTKAIREINRRSELGIDRTRAEVRDLQRIAQTELRAVQRREQATADRMREARAAIQESKLALGSKLDSSNARLERIANKDTSLNLSLTIPVASYVSVNEVVRQSTVIGTIRNNIPVGPGYP